MSATAKSATNVQVRTNVVSSEHFFADRDQFRKSLKWTELYQFLELFWQLCRDEVLHSLTPEQREEREYLSNNGLSLPDPYNSVCLAHRFLLPPFSAPLATSQEASEQRTVEQSTKGTVVDNSYPCQLENPQDKVINAPSKARQFVLAPPGTGKTHTVIQRLVRLHQPDRLAGDLTQVLMVSFSRAAASELGYRLGDALRAQQASLHTLPRLSTLDSLAGQLLYRDMGIEMDSTSYDESIRRLVAILDGREGQQAMEEAQSLIRARISIVIVDEVQDIVGIRAILVLAILRTLRSNELGILMLGDLRQAIHGFVLREQFGGEGKKIADSELRLTPFQFNREIQSQFPDIEPIEFIRQHRYSVSCQQLMNNLREAMDSDPPNLPGECPNRDRLSELVRTIPELDDPCQILGDELSGSRIAVLTWTNHQVSQLEVACREPAERTGRTLRVSGGPQTEGFPAWVARTLGDHLAQDILNEKDFLELYRQEVVNDHEQAKCHFEWLTVACRLTGRSFHVRDILDVIQRDPRIPTDLREPARTGQISISTIHQAKGREFDVVVVADPESLLRSTVTDAEEHARILYVALTRARNQVFRCKGPQWLPPALEVRTPVLDHTGESLGDLMAPTFQKALWNCQQGMRRAFIVPAANNRYRLEVEADRRVLGPLVTSEFLEDVSRQAGVSQRELTLAKPSFRLEIGQLRSRVEGKCDDRKLVLFPCFSGFLPVRI